MGMQASVDGVLLMMGGYWEFSHDGCMSPLPTTFYPGKMMLLSIQ
jgi:hypothetical protein